MGEDGETGTVGTGTHGVFGPGAIFESPIELPDDQARLTPFGAFLNKEKRT